MIRALVSITLKPQHHYLYNQDPPNQLKRQFLSYRHKKKKKPRQITKGKKTNYFTFPGCIKQSKFPKQAPSLGQAKSNFRPDPEHLPRLQRTGPKRLITGRRFNQIIVSDPPKRSSSAPLIEFRIVSGVIFLGLLGWVFAWVYFANSLIFYKWQ